MMTISFSFDWHAGTHRIVSAKFEKKNGFERIYYSKTNSKYENLSAHQLVYWIVVYYYDALRMFICSCSVNNRLELWNAFLVVAVPFIVCFFCYLFLLWMFMFILGRNENIYYFHFCNVSQTQVNTQTVLCTAHTTHTRTINMMDGNVARHLLESR